MGREGVSVYLLYYIRVGLADDTPTSGEVRGWEYVSGVWDWIWAGVTLER